KRQSGVRGAEHRDVQAYADGHGNASARGAGGFPAGATASLPGRKIRLATFSRQAGPDPGQSKLALSSKEGRDEHFHSAISPLDIDRLHADRHRELRCDGARQTAHVAGLFAVAVPLPVVVHGPLHVRAALCRERAPCEAIMTKAAKKSPATKAKEGSSPSKLIDGRIKDLGDWRGEILARVRGVIKAADPDVVEEWKWRGVPVWEHDGIICTGETYKDIVKLTFAKGAALTDPSRLFNASLEGNIRRAIDMREGEKINEKTLKALVRAAVALNTSKART